MRGDTSTSAPPLTATGEWPAPLTSCLPGQWIYSDSMRSMFELQGDEGLAGRDDFISSQSKFNQLPHLKILLFVPQDNFDYFTFQPSPFGNCSSFTSSILYLLVDHLI